MDHSGSKLQYRDQNVGPIWFSEYMKKEGNIGLIVREIFVTVQGEMPFAGRPAIFLRLGGCNRGSKLAMGCSSCDTDFMLSKSRFRPIYDVVMEVMSEVFRLNDYFSQRLSSIGMPELPMILVITGGEPLIQQQALAPFLDRLNSVLVRNRISLLVQFETNGDYEPNEELIRLANDKVYSSYGIKLAFVISPKEPHKKNPWWYSVIKYMDEKSNIQYFIRRVLSPEPDSSYYGVSQYIASLPRKYVWLSPVTVYSDIAPSFDDAEFHTHDANKGSMQAIDLEKSLESIKYAQQLCIEKGYQLSMQTHAWTNIR